MYLTHRDFRIVPGFIGEEEVYVIWNNNIFISKIQRESFYDMTYEEQWGRIFKDLFTKHTPSINVYTDIFCIRD